jgi:transposase
MAQRSGLSKSTIGRIWRKFDLKPHLTGTFKLSTDPFFVDKVVDVVGLYHHPPDKAVVLCVDEKSGIQAYPGSVLGVCDGGPEADMTDFRSVADGLSGVRSQGSPMHVIYRRSTAPDLARSPTVRSLAAPGCLPCLVVAASVTDTSATGLPAEAPELIFGTPDNQALDRSQPVLPMMPGVPERRSHDYVRHGTTDLFAAFNIAGGTVISSLSGRHRAAEFREFLARIDETVPAGLEVHMVCDNLATHKTPLIREWLARHPRFRLHFTPTGSSWINQVERWFGYLTAQKIRRGVHKSVQALETDIRAWIENWNRNPRPFAWTKTADEILDSLAKYIAKISGAGY